MVSFLYAKFTWIWVMCITGRRAEILTDEAFSFLTKILPEKRLRISPSLFAFRPDDIDGQIEHLRVTFFSSLDRLEKNNLRVFLCCQFQFDIARCELVLWEWLFWIAKNTQRVEKFLKTFSEFSFRQRWPLCEKQWKYLVSLHILERKKVQNITFARKSVLKQEGKKRSGSLFDTSIHTCIWLHLPLPFVKKVQKLLPFCVCFFWGWNVLRQSPPLRRADKSEREGENSRLNCAQLSEKKRFQIYRLVKD